jgi:hypothetical protein
MAGVEPAAAGEPPERRPRTWGRRPPGADRSHPNLLPTDEPCLFRDLTRAWPSPGEGITPREVAGAAADGRLCTVRRGAAVGGGLVWLAGTFIAAYKTPSMLINELRP